MFGAAVPFIPEIMVAEDLNPFEFCILLRFESTRLFVTSVSHSDAVLFNVEFTKKAIEKKKKIHDNYL